MDATSKNDNLAELLLIELRKTTPTACLGFPPTEECRSVRIKRMERLETERAARFQELKRAALANIKKDHP
jgi:hypothetical protein